MVKPYSQINIFIYFSHGSLSNDSSSPHGGSTSRKSPMLAPLTEKPNHIDPTVFHRKSNIGFHSAQKVGFTSFTFKC